MYGEILRTINEDGCVVVRHNVLSSWSDNLIAPGSERRSVRERWETYSTVSSKDERSATVYEGYTRLIDIRAVNAMNTISQLFYSLEQLTYLEDLPTRML